MLIIAAAALAASQTLAPLCTTGSWVSSAGGKPIFGLTIKNGPNGPEATWSRPTSLSMDVAGFSNVRGPVSHRTAYAARSKNNDLELSFHDPRPGATPDILTLHCIGNDRLKVTFGGVPFGPFEFTRVASASPQLGSWDRNKTYAFEIDLPTNAEMTSIFDADQAARSSSNIDWSVVGPADAQRRKRTKELLDSGALQSGNDYYHAAFIFQHGDQANDYLLAHLLAMIAVARGKPSAIWIASATLDRYLLKIGKPQVLGTQYSLPKGQPATQEPYDRALVSDAMRKALQVPSLADQEKQRESYSRGANPSN